MTAPIPAWNVAVSRRRRRRCRRWSRTCSTTTSSSRANSATTANDAHASRDTAQLFDDAFDAAVKRVQGAGQNAAQLFGKYHVILVLQVEPAVTTGGDPDAVQPWEAWDVSPASRPFDPRGVEKMYTARTADKNLDKQAVWSLIFFKGGKPNNSLICHELGHGLGFRDLYVQTGYRNDLDYLEDWAMMGDNSGFPHHCGSHKWQAGWIPDNRVLTIPPTAAGETTTTDLLLMPVEFWGPTLPAMAREAYDVPAGSRRRTWSSWTSVATARCST